MLMIPRPTLLTGALLLLASAIMPHATSAATARPPNVIFFLIDDWGWTDAGCFGSKVYETPHIDRLASQGMKFTQAYSACTVCSPTRAAILTGKYPARLHITDWIAGHNRPQAKLKIPEWTMHLPLEERTIAEELKSRGYATALFGKWHLGDERFYPEHQGFDVNVGGCNRGSPGNYFPPYGIPTIKDEQSGEFLTDRLTRDALKFIESNQQRPFYLYIPHYAVHTPLAGKPEVVEKYRKKIAAGNFNQTNPVYAALVESVDDSVGAVMKKLAELKLDDNTVIMLTGDNGGLSGTVNAQGWRPGPTRNDPLRLGKGSAYEGGVRVPLIVKWPGVARRGSVNETPVISTDFFPTVLELTQGAATVAGEPAGGGATKQARGTTPPDGESIVGLLKGGTGLKREAIYWHYPHYHPGSATPYSAIREGDWKLIHFFEDDHVELYNLKQDLGEKTDLAGSNPNKAAELRTKLDAWRTAVGAQLPTKNPKHDAAKEWESDRPAEKAGGKAKKKA
jgi:arylsulfatase A